jgi:hypothetical protein
MASVVAKGDQFVFGQSLDDVAEFIGLVGSGHNKLPPADLYTKWIHILRAAQRYMRQIPDARLNERIIYNRDRSIRRVCFHIFRIGEAFLETVVDGVEWVHELPKTPPPDDAFRTGDEIARYGESIIVRLQQWWGTCTDRTCQQKVKTFFGMQTTHMLFERCTWHSAQHSRQLIALLERFDIQPDGYLTGDDLAGLLLPERLWE